MLDTPNTLNAQPLALAYVVVSWVRNILADRSADAADQMTALEAVWAGSRMHAQARARAVKRGEPAAVRRRLPEEGA